MTRLSLYILFTLAGLWWLIALVWFLWDEMALLWEPAQ